jgi:hypothetical protein
MICFDFEFFVNRCILNVLYFNASRNANKEVAAIFGTLFPAPFNKLAYRVLFFSQKLE